MKATLLDTVTGHRWQHYDGITPFQWSEGNWSCDCNRHPPGEEDWPEGPSTCEGRKRFLVVSAEPEDGETHYALAELNPGYPPELLRKHGIIT